MNRLLSSGIGKKKKTKRTNWLKRVAGIAPLSPEEVAAPEAAPPAASTTTTTNENDENGEILPQTHETETHKKPSPRENFRKFNGDPVSPSNERISSFYSKRRDGPGIKVRNIEWRRSLGPSASKANYNYVPFNNPYHGSASSSVAHMGPMALLHAGLESPIQVDVADPFLKPKPTEPSFFNPASSRLLGYSTRPYKPRPLSLTPRNDASFTVPPANKSPNLSRRRHLSNRASFSIPSHMKVSKRPASISVPYSRVPLNDIRSGIKDTKDPTLVRKDPVLESLARMKRAFDEEDRQIREAKRRRIDIIPPPLPLPRADVGGFFNMGEEPKEEERQPKKTNAILAAEQAEKEEKEKLEKEEKERMEKEKQEEERKVKERTDEERKLKEARQKEEEERKNNEKKKINVIGVGSKRKAKGNKSAEKPTISFNTDGLTPNQFGQKSDKVSNFGQSSDGPSFNSFAKATPSFTAPDLKGSDPQPKVSTEKESSTTPTKGPREENKGSSPAKENASKPTTGSLFNSAAGSFADPTFKNSAGSFGAPSSKPTTELFDVPSTNNVGSSFKTSESTFQPVERTETVARSAKRAYVPSDVDDESSKEKKGTTAPGGFGQFNNNVLSTNSFVTAPSTDQPISNTFGSSGAGEAWNADIASGKNSSSVFDRAEEHDVNEDDDGKSKRTKFGTNPLWKASSVSPFPISASDNDAPKTEKAATTTSEEREEGTKPKGNENKEDKEGNQQQQNNVQPPTNQSDSLNPFPSSNSSSFPFSSSFSTQQADQQDRFSKPVASSADKFGSQSKDVGQNGGTDGSLEEREVSSKENIDKEKDTEIKASILGGIETGGNLEGSKPAVTGRGEGESGSGTKKVTVAPAFGKGVFGAGADGLDVGGFVGFGGNQTSTGQVQDQTGKAKDVAGAEEEKESTPTEDEGQEDNKKPKISLPAFQFGNGVNAAKESAPPVGGAGFNFGAVGGEDKKDNKSEKEEEKTNSNPPSVFGQGTSNAASTAAPVGLPFGSSTFGKAPSEFGLGALTSGVKNDENGAKNDNVAQDNVGGEADKEKDSGDMMSTALTPPASKVTSNTLTPTPFSFASGSGSTTKPTFGLTSNGPMFGGSSETAGAATSSTAGPFADSKFSASFSGPSNMSTFVFGSGGGKPMEPQQNPPLTGGLGHGLGGGNNTSGFAFGAAPAPNTTTTTPKPPSSGFTFGSSNNNNNSGSGIGGGGGSTGGFGSAPGTMAAFGSGSGAASNPFATGGENNNTSTNNTLGMNNNNNNNLSTTNNNTLSAFGSNGANTTSLFGGVSFNPVGGATDAANPFATNVNNNPAANNNAGNAAGGGGGSGFSFGSSAFNTQGGGNAPGGAGAFNPGSTGAPTRRRTVRVRRTLR